MSGLVTALRELIGLFVEDGAFATGILMWLGAATAALVILAHRPDWGGPVLFLGLAVFLVYNVYAATRR